MSQKVWKYTPQRVLAVLGVPEEGESKTTKHFTNTVHL